MILVKKRVFTKKIENLFKGLNCSSSSLKLNAENHLKKQQRLIESMIGLRPSQGNLRLVFRLLSLVRGLPSIRLK